MTRSEEAEEEAKIDEEVIGKDHYITMFTTYVGFCQNVQYPLSLASRRGSCLHWKSPSELDSTYMYLYIYIEVKLVFLSVHELSIPVKDTFPTIL